MNDIPEKRLTAVLIHHLADGTKLFELAGTTFGIPTPSEIANTKEWGADLATAYLNDEPLVDGTIQDVLEISTTDGRVVRYHKSKAVYIECDVLVEDLKPGDESTVMHNREAAEIRRIGDEVLKEET